jgi:large subunit ribosomal protein L10
MARPDKATAVAELTEDFKSADAIALTEYRGLTVGAMKTLRRSLGMETKYAVVKNTLTKIAAKNAGVEIDDSLLKGPSAVAFIKGDSLAAAKTLKNFQKENPLLVIKGGIFDGKPVSTEEIMKLADLESREVLLSKLAGAMKGTMAKAARTFDALRIKLEAGAPATSAEAAPAPVAEAVAPAAEEAAPAVSEDAASNAEAEVPAVAETTEAVAVTESTTETSAE